MTVPAVAALALLPFSPPTFIGLRQGLSDGGGIALGGGVGQAAGGGAGLGAGGRPGLRESRGARGGGHCAALHGLSCHQWPVHQQP